MATKIKHGAIVKFVSKTHKGMGRVVKQTKGATGPWVKVKTADHPRGHVTVRPSQVS